jgi:hypothetical protein
LIDDLVSALQQYHQLPLGSVLLTGFESLTEIALLWLSPTDQKDKTGSERVLSLKAG